ncbi:PAS domain-containing protein [Streptomyces sp. NPDC001530]|uniref:PAS domain-containing protein n=1 Tax=Streptomyces sp. NPDC001530 TaxID=3364582 RepID=UPI0036ABDBF7
MTPIAEAWGSVFDVVRQPVWAVDAEHTVRYANPAAAETTGHARPSDLGAATVVRPPRPPRPGRRTAPSGARARSHVPAARSYRWSGPGCPCPRRTATRP